MALIVNKRYTMSIQTECDKVELNDMLYLFPSLDEQDMLVYELEEKGINYRTTKKRRDEFI